MPEDGANHGLQYKCTRQRIAARDVLEGDGDTAMALRYKPMPGKGLVPATREGWKRGHWTLGIRQCQAGSEVSG